jgi:hypothetical protein
VPSRLELRQQLIRATDRLGVAGHALRATILPLRHQPRPFKDSHVLLHGGERHLVPPGQLADRGVGVEYSREDVATGGIGQCAEQLIQLV